MYHQYCCSTTAFRPDAKEMYTHHASRRSTCQPCSLVARSMIRDATIGNETTCSQATRGDDRHAVDMKRAKVNSTYLTSLNLGDGHCLYFSFD